jgi:hypothetical protein
MSTSAFGMDALLPLTVAITKFAIRKMVPRLQVFAKSLQLTPTHPVANLKVIMVCILMLQANVKIPHYNHNQHVLQKVIASG